MDPKCRAVLDAALELPQDARAIIAEMLLATLSPEEDETSDDDLASELDRRLEESVRDPASTVAWSELRDGR
jgi:putative addiction module component (TIGR02574 family)